MSISNSPPNSSDDDDDLVAPITETAANDSWNGKYKKWVQD